MPTDFSQLRCYREGIRHLALSHFEAQYVSVPAVLIFVVISKVCAPGPLVLTIGLAECVLAIRTWAVCHCDLRVGLLLGALQMCHIVLSCIASEHYQNSLVCELSSSAAIID
jgi:hypothetical protein